MAPYPMDDISSQAGSKDQLTSIKFKKGSRISQLTRLEKAFIVLLVLVSIALIAVIIVLVTKSDNDNSSASSSPNQDLERCTSIDCVNAASSIYGKMDTTAKPCENFYQFACGNWMTKRVIPQDRSRISIFTDLSNEVNIALKKLLETNVSTTDTEYTAKAKTLYSSCFNYDHINSRGISPLVNFLNQEYGGWPLTTSGWDEATFNLTEMVTNLTLNNCDPLFYFYTSTDSKNSSKRLIMLDQPGFGMPGQKYYQVERNDTFLMAYQKLIFDIGDVFGFANSGTAAKEVADIVDFEMKIANISVPAEDRRDNNALYNPMTMHDISVNYSKILDWKRYMYSILTSPGIEVANVTDQETIINVSPLYFDRLNEVIKDTPKRTLANYFLWRQVRNLIFTQGESIQKLYSVYKKVLYGVESNPPRYRTCVGYVNDNLGLAVGSLFVKDHFDAHSKTEALAMIQDLHQAFDEILDEIDWMDEKTRQVAKEKNKYISPKIGYPKELTNHTFMVEYYKQFEYEADRYMENVIVNRKQSYKNNMKRLREPVDKNQSLFEPAVVNAFYSFLRSHILFPAGILQPPFFSKNFPKFLNYGAIGMVIGHEITHGFDDRGRQYDKEGNLVQWWTQSAIDKFKTRSQCIVDQYSNFTMDDINMNLNGILTQGENIADNGGLKQSYKAYRNWVARQGKEEKGLPGLDYNPNQLFFISFAQMWCNAMRDEEAINRIRTGVHSPGRFRVIGSMQNFETFSDVFKCSVDSPMNPKKKCSVW